MESGDAGWLSRLDRALSRCDDAANLPAALAQGLADELPIDRVAI